MMSYLNICNGRNQWNQWVYTLNDTQWQTYTLNNSLAYSSGSKQTLLTDWQLLFDNEVTYELSKQNRNPNRKVSPISRPERKAQSPTNNPMFHWSRYKTEMCRNVIETNECRFGNGCLFAHSKGELRKCTQRHPKYRTVKCRDYHNNGYCDFGWRCHFIHKDEDTSLQLLQMCQKVPMERLC